MNNKVEIVNDLLGYEGLKIIQRPDIFNFSLDSTILADFVTINKKDKLIVDMGCGNGYIPIFLTLRTKAKIYGIEIQEEIYDIAKRSVELNKLEQQVNVINCDMKEAYKKFPNTSVDVVTCNPPYFKFQEDSKINKNDYLTIARHEVLVNLDQVVESAKRLLKDGGTFAMVHRSDRLIDIIEAFRKHKIEPKKIRFVYPKKNSASSLAILIEGKKSSTSGGLTILNPLYVNDEHGNYTEEILKIYNYKKDSNND